MVKGQQFCPLVTVQLHRRPRSKAHCCIYEKCAKLQDFLKFLPDQHFAERPCIGAIDVLLRVGHVQIHVTINRHQNSCGK